MDSYDALFEDIGRSLNERFGELSLPLRLIGRAALEMAGLTERGTKDVDTLEEFLRVGVLSDGKISEIESFLKDEFGKGSPGALRHGLYLDLVEKGIAWLPPHPHFIDERQLSSVSVSRLHPVDICVSKTFSHFREWPRRAQDRKDILETVGAGLADVAEYVKRMGESLKFHEIQSRVAEFYPRIIEFIENEIIAKYGDPSMKLEYALPSWMENI